MANQIQVTVVNVGGTPQSSPVTMAFPTDSIIISNETIATSSSAVAKIQLFYAPFQSQEYYVTNTFASMVTAANTNWVSQVQVTAYSINGNPQRTALNIGLPVGQISLQTVNASPINTIVSFMKTIFGVSETESAIVAAANTGGSIPISQITQSDDYIISTDGTTITATPRNGTGLSLYSGTDAYTVIQAAITALTPSGSTGSSGGKIHINKGVYSLSNELLINGWEGNANPYSQIIIEGSGQSTQLQQQTAAKNGIVVKNSASFVLSSLQIYCIATAKSCILADDNGASETGCYKCIIDNVILISNSTTQPALYLKNFFDVSIPMLHVDATANDGILLQNTSASTSYGNSNFGFIRSTAGSGFAGLRVTSTNSNGTQFINQMSFQNYECAFGATYGIYSTSLHYSIFEFVDIEQAASPIYFGGGTNIGETRSVTIADAYLLPTNGGTAITNTINTGGNTINAYIEGDATCIPVLDQQQFRAPNSYSLVFGINVVPGNISITSPTLTPIVYRAFNGFTTTQVFASGTKTSTPTAGDNSTILATTAYIDTVTTVSITGTISLSSTAFNKLHLCSGTSADYTVVLPTAVGNTGRWISFRGVTALTKIVTIDGNASETINGLADRKLSSQGVFTILSDGANWGVVYEIASIVPYTPNITGVTSQPTLVAWYSLIGKLLTVSIQTNSTAANATGMAAGLPTGFTASGTQDILVRVQSNSSFVSGMAEISDGSNGITFYAAADGTAIAATGNKAVIMTMTIRVQ